MTQAGPAPSNLALRTPVRGPPRSRAVPEGDPSMFKSLSSSLLWRGLLAVVVGVVSVAWPNITVGGFVILFAVYAFLAAGTDTARAFSSGRAGPVAGYLLLALLSVAAG